MEELIEWIGEFIVELFTGTRKILWLLIATILITLGILQLVRESEIKLAIVFLLLGIAFLLFPFLRKDKRS
jgi:predicted membrane protein